MRHFVFIFLPLNILIMATAIAYSPASINIAAASDMKFAMDELVRDFKKDKTTLKVNTIMGSSGKFFEQIVNGASYDLFFSADIELTNKLVAYGKAERAYPYARGRIVIWNLKSKITDLKQLNSRPFQKIAIANPLHAPYGARAKEALERSGIYSEIKSRLVFGENISQTAQFIDSGAADVGIVALSLVLSPSLRNKGFYHLIPEQQHSPLEQGFVLLNSQNKDAVNFANYMNSPRARSILANYGFTLTNHGK